MCVSFYGRYLRARGKINQRPHRATSCALIRKGWSLALWLAVCRASVGWTASIHVYQRSHQVCGWPVDAIINCRLAPFLNEGIVNQIWDFMVFDLFILVSKRSKALCPGSHSLLYYHHMMMRMMIDGRRNFQEYVPSAAVRIERIPGCSGLWLLRLAFSWDWMEASGAGISELRRVNSPDPSASETGVIPSFFGESGLPDVKVMWEEEDDYLWKIKRTVPDAVGNENNKESLLILFSSSKGL